ncbi:MAG: NUDIX domain-containing protein, partial [Clostridiales bacterium]|nr:NUDIX domain-containing protein [Clostridiales bacterium]
MIPIVQVWILTGAGEFLVSRRAAGKDWPLMWETTGGRALDGEDSLTAALREAWEELGISLDPAKGEIFSSFILHRPFGIFAVDAWLFRQDFSISDIRLCPDETCDVMLATPEKIREIMAAGQFVDVKEYPYLDDLFELAGDSRFRGNDGGEKAIPVVQVWILNPAGEFLVSKRAAAKTWPLMWECTGGSATVGEDSITAALKEAREELGVILDPANGLLFRRFVKLCSKAKNGSGSIIDAWLFRQDFSLSDITLC